MFFLHLIIPDVGLLEIINVLLQTDIFPQSLKTVEPLLKNNNLDV